MISFSINGIDFLEEDSTAAMSVAQAVKRVARLILGGHQSNRNTGGTGGGNSSYSRIWTGKRGAQPDGAFTES
jgi:hypothetical protein